MYLTRHVLLMSDRR